MNGLLHHRPQNIVLAFEVMKNTPRLNTHHSRQIPNRCAIKTATAEQVRSSLHQLATRR
jgi:hypothetical protein